ncbi:MAG: hypothetical protein Q7U91_14120 [Sideroxyarcus sp.]|nr:hypothetical protein [Sideroxyarcus sp.]
MKKYALPFLLGFFVSILVTAITLSMESWAPSVYGGLESVGDYQFKPWVFSAPAIAALFITAIAHPKFRNMRAFTALFAGGLFSILAGVAMLLVLAAGSLPNMRY